MAVREGKTEAKYGDPAEKGALISDATLVELHRRLLSVVHGRKAADRYAAAHVALEFDLRAGDLSINGKGNRVKEALGAALLNKARKNRRIVLVWGGEATEEWQDPLEAARAHSIPIVFVGEYGEGQNGRAVVSRANHALKPGDELPCVMVDGHDVVAAYRVAHEAIERARRDRGPTLILLTTYRVGGRAFTNAAADMERYLRGRGITAGKDGQRDRGNKKAGA